jgi:predicted AAA+ superfamily ATPase
MSLKRKIKAEMDIYKNKYPILAVTGPRQSGKTTFLKRNFLITNM